MRTHQVEVSEGAHLSYSVDIAFDGTLPLKKCEVVKVRENANKNVVATVRHPDHENKLTCEAALIPHKHLGDNKYEFQAEAMLAWNKGFATNK